MAREMTPQERAAAVHAKLVLVPTREAKEDNLLTLEDAIKETRRAALLEPIQWLKEFIEWNACYEQGGKYQCNQCGRQAIAGQSNHDDDCDIITARALLDRLAQEG